MAVEWTTDLATGLDWQDNEHRELFRIMSELLESMIEGRGKQEVVKTLDFLDDYVENHFKGEEDAMDKFQYSDVVLHKAEHRKFIDTIVSLRNDLIKTGTNTALVLRTQRHLVDWFKSHISKIDKKLGAFLTARSAVV